MSADSPGFGRVHRTLTASRAAAAGDNGIQPSPIITEVDKQGLTHAQAAERTGTSRSRMTSILNGAIQDVSTDLLLRVLSALGIRARISFAKAA